MTSWDGLPLDQEPSATSDASADRSAPDGDAGAADAMDASPADQRSPEASGGCSVGAYYCGGDEVVGDPSTLYQCTKAGPSAVLVCQHGCARRAGRDDACICVAGSPYCGGDQVLGDPQTLYTCNADYSTTLVKRCPTQCLVVAGQNDTCK